MVKDTKILFPCFLYITKNENECICNHIIYISFFVLLNKMIERCGPAQRFEISIEEEETVGQKLFNFVVSKERTECEFYRLTNCA